MKDFKDIFGTDSALEEDGAWLSFGAFDLKIARYGNKRHDDALKRLRKPHIMAIRAETIEEETAEDILIKSLAEGILVDWRGVVDDGVELTYSRDNAEKLLRKYKDLRALIIRVANEQELFRKAADEDAEKN